MARKSFDGSTASNFYKFTTPGQVLEGTWVGTEKSMFLDPDTKENKLTGIILPTGAEEPVKFDPSKVILSCFEEAFGGIQNCPAGTKLWLTFTSTKAATKPGYKPTKLFTLEIDEEEAPF